MSHPYHFDQLDDVIALWEKHELTPRAGTYLYLDAHQSAGYLVTALFLDAGYTPDDVLRVVSPAGELFLDRVAETIGASRDWLAGAASGFDGYDSTWKKLMLVVASDRVLAAEPPAEVVVIDDDDPIWFTVDWREGLAFGTAVRKALLDRGLLQVLPTIAVGEGSCNATT